MKTTKDRILISTIIPSYNRAETVGDTINSILAQQVDADIEIIIGDDCSTDNVRDILLAFEEKYPNIIHLIFHENNIGLGANWATCVKACQGKYICNCDNDDYWHKPNKLQLQLDFMESHPQSNICVTNHRTHNRKTGEIKECLAMINHADIQRDMWDNGHFCNATIMYRTDFLKAHLDLNEFINRHLSLQDWPTWVILTAYTDIDVIPVSTATCGVETTSITRPASVEQLARRYEKDKEVCRYLGELFPKKFPFTDSDWNRFVAGRLIAEAYETNDFQSAKYYSQQHPTGISKLKASCAHYKWTFNLFIKLHLLHRALTSRFS